MRIPDQLFSLNFVAAKTYVPVVGLSCCSKVSTSKIPGTVKLCYEQKPRVDCNRHAFRIMTEDDKEWCVDPAARWLKRKIRRVRIKQN
uniref:Chemokine interleukin-8-like domain-containing protein n=1 Tax=Takifugu rubripes TaxID=31033 RepID=A0A3B5K6V2_TAKRU